MSSELSAFLSSCANHTRNSDSKDGSCRKSRRRSFRTFTEAGMKLTPKLPSPVFLPQKDINDKFEILDLLPKLNDTCFIQRLKPIKVEDSPKGIKGLSSGKKRHDRKWDWKVESFIRKSDETCMAIIHWRLTVTGSEEREIQQFEAPDGTWYSVDSVKHPERGVSSK